MRGKAKESKWKAVLHERSTADCSVPRDTFPTSHAEPLCLGTSCLWRKGERSLYVCYFLLSALLGCPLWWCKFASWGSNAPIFWVCLLTQQLPRRQEQAEPQGFSPEPGTGGRSQCLRLTIRIGLRGRWC